MSSQQGLRDITIAQLKAFGDAPDSLGEVIGSIDEEIQAARQDAYSDAREKAISAFLSIVAGGFSEHVVMENYTSLRDYLDNQAKVTT